MENLQQWLPDEKAWDQFVIRAGTDTEVLWNDASHLKPESVYKRTYWTDKFCTVVSTGNLLGNISQAGGSCFGWCCLFQSFNALRPFTGPRDL